MDNPAVHYSSERDDWATPQWLIDELRREGYAIVLDVTARPDNSKAPFWIPPETNALRTDWSRPFALAIKDQAKHMSGHRPRAWMNPPYGKPENPCPADRSRCSKKACEKRGYHIDERQPGIEDFVNKAHREALAGVPSIILIPARQAQWWKGPLLKKDPKTGLWLPRYSMDFFTNRIQFEGAESGAPFPSMLVYMEEPTTEAVIRYREAHREAHNV